MIDFIDDTWLPVIFVALMGLSVLIYAILDGYDLGVGILLPRHDETHRDKMIASIGPFWDANETWLVLAIGLLLIAFPAANALVSAQLYLPMALMLMGLILRGVAFDFRTKSIAEHKGRWELTFKLGSLLTTLMQGYMLGLYIMGFEDTWQAQGFAMLSALCVTAAYSYIGGAWLIMKTTGDLQQQAIRWTRLAGRAALLGVISVSIVNPLVNPGVFDKWFTYPLAMFVLIIPMVCFASFVFIDRLLAKMPLENDQYCWLPFLIIMLIFTLCFIGLGFSFFPQIIPGGMTIWEAASAAESLRFILMGAMVVVPMILFYTAISYWVFRGKTTALKYY